MTPASAGEDERPHAEDDQPRSQSVGPGYYWGAGDLDVMNPASNSEKRNS
jgi:hypothetical protein